jgi:hypothetical protein
VRVEGCTACVRSLGFPSVRNLSEGGGGGSSAAVRAPHGRAAVCTVPDALLFRARHRCAGQVYRTQLPRS